MILRLAACSIGVVAALSTSGFDAGVCAAAEPGSFARETRAEELARRARDSRDGAECLATWRRVTELVPEKTSFWLARADTELEMGYLEEARQSLASARATIDSLDGEARSSAIRDYALGVAWWDYEMGRFEKGLEWARRAVELGAGLPGQLIYGIHFARFVESWSELQHWCGVFQPLRSGANRRANYSWILVTYTLENGWPPFDAEQAESWLHRSKSHYEHDRARWRDYGLWCEVNGARGLAVDYYEKSVESLPIKKGGWISRAEAATPDPAGGTVDMPFWTNPDLGYVTGSLLAYCAFLHAELERAGSARAREDLAGKLDPAVLRAVDRFPRRPQLNLWRVDALSALGRCEEAIEETRRARTGYRKLGLPGTAIDRAEGHVLVQAGRYADAVAPLRRVTESSSTDATAWAELGVAYLRSGNDADALLCFGQALQIDPDQVNALYERGRVLWRVGDHDAGLADIEHAARLAPGRAEIQETLQRLREAPR